MAKVPIAEASTIVRTNPVTLDTIVPAAMMALARNMRLIRIHSPGSWRPVPTVAAICAVAAVSRPRRA